MLFIAFSLLVSFFIMMEYGITRPASNAFFLTTFSTKGFPWVWLATIPLNLFVIFLYNRFLPKIGPLKMMFTVAVFVALINLLSFFLVPNFPGFIFFQYAWKDIYILLMFKQLWSMIHTTIPKERAKALYGFFFGIGAIGALLGNSIPAFFAVRLGSETLFLFTPVLYSFLLLFYTLAYRRSSLQSTPYTIPKEKSSFRESLQLIYSSKFLLCILGLVISMQMVGALFEVQMNLYLEQHLKDKNLITAYFGWLSGIINIVNGSLQFLGVYLLVRFLGLGGSHALIPITLGASALCCGLMPLFSIAVFSFVAAKAFDYSLFGVIRELLYPSLKLDEKFRAKAIIDVFAHRTAKSIASILLLFLPWTAIPYLALGICCAWGAVVFIMFNSNATRLAPVSTGS